MRKITFVIEELRAALEKLPKQPVRMPGARGTVDAVDYDDVLGVLFGDIPEHLR